MIAPAVAPEPLAVARQLQRRWLWTFVGPQAVALQLALQPRRGWHDPGLAAMVLRAALRGHLLPLRICRHLGPQKLAVASAQHPCQHVRQEMR